MPRPDSAPRLWRLTQPCSALFLPRHRVILLRSSPQFPPKTFLPLGFILGSICGEGRRNLVSLHREKLRHRVTRVVMYTLSCTPLAIVRVLSWIPWSAVRHKLPRRNGLQPPCSPSVAGSVYLRMAAPMPGKQLLLTDGKPVGVCTALPLPVTPLRGCK